MPRPIPGTVDRDFEALLARAADSARALAAHLADERRALESEDLEALASAAAAKQASVERLESLEAERRGLLAGRGLNDDVAGMQALIDACGDAAALRGLWQSYLGLAEDCRRANLTNGAIIRLRHQQLAVTFEALSGGRAPTYGPAGSTRSAASRSLAEA